jgi:putative ABC transport system substrate-binding protein
MVRDKAEAAIVLADAIFNSQVRQIAGYASSRKLPVIAGTSEYVQAGCLMSYGASFRDNFHRAAYYVDRIFKGAKPADLPVEQPTTFELVINSKTAKALGLTIPQSLLISAVRVIE